MGMPPIVDAKGSSLVFRKYRDLLMGARKSDRSKTTGGNGTRGCEGF